MSTLRSRRNPRPNAAKALMQGKTMWPRGASAARWAGLQISRQGASSRGPAFSATAWLGTRDRIRPEDICREDFISTARAAPVLKTVIEEYAAKIGIKLKQIYDAETLSGGMSLVASTGGFTLLPTYVQSALIPSVVARPLHGEVPTIDLVMGYNKSNTSPLLKKFLLRADELTLVRGGKALSSANPLKLNKASGRILPIRSHQLT